MENKFFHDATEYDGRPILEIKSFKDIETLKEYKERKENVRIVIKPTTCIDKYEDLITAINEVIGNTPSKGYNITLKKHIGN